MSMNFTIRSLGFAGTAPGPGGQLACDNIECVTRDIIEGNYFCPAGDENGPYDLEMAIVEGKLAFRILNALGNQLPVLVLSVTPYRRLIKDYFILCESLQDARLGAGPARMEALDMGRRSLHDEGAELLMRRLAGKIEIDHATARKLFTLICTLHGNRPRY
jgi:uncharacterized protein (UPF0262 family)